MYAVAAPPRGGAHDGRGVYGDYNREVFGSSDFFIFDCSGDLSLQVLPENETLGVLLFLVFLL